MIFDYMKYIEKIIEYGLYLLAFLLPLQTRWIIKPGEINGGYFEYGTISLYGTDILLVIIVLLYGYVVIKRGDWKIKVKNSKFIYWALIALLDITIFVSIFFAFDKILALYRYGLFLIGIGLFWLMMNANYKKIKLIWSFLIGIFLQASLGIWQFLFQSSFACKWLGLASHNSTESGVSVVEAVASDGIGERWLRAYGGVDHPNILGGILAVGLLLVIYLYFYNIESNLKKKLELKSFVIHFLFFIFALALFFTFSRGAWIGFAFAILIILFYTILKKNLIQQKKILEIIFALSILTFILFSQYGYLVSTRFSNSSRLEKKSTNERIEFILEAKNIIKENWLFGVGIGNYGMAVEEKRPNSNTWDYQPAHNVFFLIWAEIGVIGFLTYFAILIYAIWLSIKNTNNIGLPLLSVLVIIMIVDHWLWSLHFGILFFWIMIGLIIKNANFDKQELTN